MKRISKRLNLPVTWILLILSFITQYLLIKNDGAKSWIIFIIILAISFLAILLSIWSIYLIVKKDSEKNVIRSINMNNTLNIIKNRYSCRAFDGKMPPKGMLEAIAMAAVQSPSAMNNQPWKIYVITNAALINEMDKAGLDALANFEDTAAYERMMARGGKLFYNAPCMFLIAKQSGADLDCGIVCENIALAAASLELGNVICGLAGLAFKNEEFTKKIGIPEGYEFGMSVLVGYSVSPTAPHEIDASKIEYID